MRPIALFDKSFLQSLSLDESVWFDHFFLSTICPLFFVETLADLEKAVRSGRTPEQEVGGIARKTPEMNGTPCAYHVDLAIANLLGHAVPMTGQIPLAGGRFVESEGKVGVVYEESFEAKALSRWNAGKFLDVERLFAQAWRAMLSALDLEEVAKSFKSVGIDGKTCKSLEEARAIAQSLVSGTDKPFDRMKLALTFLGAGPEVHRPILQRWSIAGYPPISTYAPYAAYVVSVDVFFQVALAAALISSDRPSNRTDIAYLFYLPFCMIFLSSDRFHQRCAPLFLRPEQEFVWGQDLKADLAAINSHFLGLPDSEKEKGLMYFASKPPVAASALVSALWDRHIPGWRDRPASVEPRDPEDEKKLVDHLMSFEKAPGASLDQIPSDTVELDMVTLSRRIRKRKGSWWQLDKNLEDKEQD